MPRTGHESRSRSLSATRPPPIPASWPPKLQLADFGFSKDANQHSAPNSRVGTPAYLAPEVVKLQLGQKYDGQVRRLWLSRLLSSAGLASGGAAAPELVGEQLHLSVARCVWRQVNSHCHRCSSADAQRQPGELGVLGHACALAVSPRAALQALHLLQLLARFTPPAPSPPTDSCPPHTNCLPSQKADIWSCGVALYALVTNELPFRCVPAIR